MTATQNRILNQRLANTCNPALADLDTAFALAFPESFPAFPPGYNQIDFYNVLNNAHPHVSFVSDH